MLYTGAAGSEDKRRDNLFSFPKLGSSRRYPGSKGIMERRLALIE